MNDLRVTVHEVYAARAICECGWKGPLRDTKFDAWPDRDDHVLAEHG